MLISDVSFLIIIMKLLAFSFLVIFVYLSAHLAIFNRHRDFRQIRLSLLASFVVGTLAFFIPLIIHGGEKANISWGTWLVLVQPFSWFGLLFFGITGFVLINFILRLAQRAYRPKILTINKMILSESSQTSREEELQLLVVTIPPNWVKNPQFVVASLTSSSFVLLFYFLFGDEPTSRAATLFVYGMFLGLLSHIMRLKANKLLAILEHGVSNRTD